MAAQFDPQAEWLEADGLGGFASGTVSGVRSRRYHALLLTAVTPPAGRTVLVNGFDAWIETAKGTFALSSQNYAPDVIHPDGAVRITAFVSDPWPHWQFQIEDDILVEQELYAVRGSATVFVSWKIMGTCGEPVTLHIRPFLSGRDFHALHHENDAFNFEPTINREQVIWRPYSGVPAIYAQSNGQYRQDPTWYRNFIYREEQSRGLDCMEDLASSGIFTWNLDEKPAVLALAAEGYQFNSEDFIHDLHARTREEEYARRHSFASPLHRAADAYVVKREEGKTIIAGYPWFGDWGRDTFIAMRGLCITTGRMEDARDILMAWADVVSEGMLPNRFPDTGEQPEYNSVDSSLWYVIAVYDYLQAVGDNQKLISNAHRQRLYDAVQAILTGYSQGTRFGIKLDDDGLLAAGVPGVQLTWMDAKIGDWVVTPRVGKPVEVNALWLNALWIGGKTAPKWNELFEYGRKAFQLRFWNEERGCLFDVIDCDHQNGANDPSFRPNQIFAVSGLPVSLIDDERAACILTSVEEKLLTPLGLRSLAPDESNYRPRYEGGAAERDGSYHQGTVWPWLIGPFVEAWLRVHGDTDESRREARERFLAPLLDHLQCAGLGHVSEITDAESPYEPRGCPFQAWSLGELLRLQKICKEFEPGTKPLQSNP